MDNFLAMELGINGQMQYIQSIGWKLFFKNYKLVSEDECNMFSLLDADFFCNGNGYQWTDAIYWIKTLFCNYRNWH